MLDLLNVAANINDVFQIKNKMMADTATRLDAIAEDYVNIIEEARDLKCECCIQYKTELTKVTSE
jgi:hypothetical protein